MITDANILKVDLGIIKENIKILKSIAHKKFYAVVKADAYGLGAVRISKSIEDLVDAFCVATINEAIELRDAGIKKDILILGYIHPNNYKLLNEYDLITTIYDYEIAKSINDLGLKIRAHIKIETGHNRLGFKVEDEELDKIKLIDKFENIQIEGMFSHLSSADGEAEGDNEYTFNQERKFAYAIEYLKEINSEWTKHLSNDAGVIAFDFNYDVIRSGISMYGVYPSIPIKEHHKIGIKQSFELISKISFIKEIEEGESISYNRTFTAKRKTKVATVSLGYADGYHRVISNKGYVLINGKKAQILGSITMDQIMVDVSEIECKVHDDVVFIGKSKEEEIDVDLVASWANTISYEIMTSFSKRLSRVYKE